MIKQFIKETLQTCGFDLVKYDRRQKVYEQLYRKYAAYTMIPRESFVLNLQLCDRFSNVGGDVVECGVWKGGMSAAMSEVLGVNRTFHLYDSFEGLPPAKEIDGPNALAWQQNTTAENYFDNCSAVESFAIDAMRLANCPNYFIHKGWFDKTTGQYDGGTIAVLRLDGDWYDSVFVCLEALFPKVADGGVVIIDDYYTWDGCTRAVHDYLSSIKSSSRIYQWKNDSAYIIKRSVAAK
jgi:O-methyltransferase